MPTPSIPENVRILWPSSAGTPSGWTTDSNFNDRFPYGSSSGSSNGGADNHSHNGNSHSHGGSSHTHAFNYAQANEYWPGNECNVLYMSLNYYGMGNNGRMPHHTHGGTSGSANTSGSSNASNGFNSASTVPSYYAFRVIKSNGEGEGFPANSVVLWNTASNPTSESGWSQHSGSVGKFVRGGSNGGGTGGGSHSHTGGSHSHSGGGGSHNHTASSAPAIGGQPAGNNCGDGNQPYYFYASKANHTHTMPSLGSGTQPGGTSNTGSGNSGGTTYEPAYYSVWGVTNSSDSWLEGGIGFLCGESVPDDWVLCNGSNSTPNLNASKLIKLSSSGGSITSGGGTSHNHGNPGGHGHSGSGNHNHSLGNLSGQNCWIACGSTTNRGFQWYGPMGTWQNRRAWGTTSVCGHTHPLSSVSPSGGGFGSATNGIASNSSHPAYRQVQWIMAPEEPSEGGGNVGMYGAAF